MLPVLLKFYQLEFCPYTFRLYINTTTEILQILCLILLILLLPGPARLLADRSRKGRFVASQEFWEQRLLSSPDVPS